jgi:hypothetical protein
MNPHPREIVRAPVNIRDESLDVDLSVRQYRSWDPIDRVRRDQLEGVLNASFQNSHAPDKSLVRKFLGARVLIRVIGVTQNRPVGPITDGPKLFADVGESFVRK